MSLSIATTAQDQSRTDELPVVAAINCGLEKAWSKRLLPEPTLDTEELCAIAARKERAELEGGQWQEALASLTGDLRRTANLNALGRTIANGLIVRTLRQRIRAARCWKRHPAATQAPIASPVIVLGHMRSGTTRLHRLLACDRRFAFTRLHETLQPVPRSSAGAIASAAVLRAFLNRCNPQLGSIHPTHSFAPEEEFGLHAFSLHGAMFEAQWPVPTFARWSEQRELGPVYREFRKLLQMLRWRRGDPPAKVQLLKAPQFMQDLDAVLAEFPDARVLWMQRNAAEVTASSASLVWHQQRLQSDTADRLRIGSEWHRKTLLRQQRAEAALRLHPNVPMLPVDYDQVGADWRSAVRRIYDFLGMPLNADVLRRMERVAGRSDHVGHVYSGAEFGLAG